jgi:predicted nucleic acid-binding protein
MTRNLRDLPDGSTILVDANVVIYALSPQSRTHSSSKHLLDRGASRAVSLHMTGGAVADVIHRAMVLELLSQGQVRTSGEAVSQLKERPDIVRQLSRYRAILRDLTQVGINILPLTYRDLHASREYRERIGLLANDSLLVAVMRREHIVNLATNDADFDRVPDISVWMPESVR